MHRTRGFTLIELMIAVAIIALLALMAVPAFARARQRTRIAKFMNALRVATGAFDQYATEHAGSYPPDVNRGITPAGMQSYFGDKLDWTAPTPIGGNWDWDVDVFGVKAGVSIVNSSLSDSEMKQIDAEIDDGNLNTGSFQLTGPGRYTAIVDW